MFNGGACARRGRIQGVIMSHSFGATRRRLSLLATSSLAVVGLVGGLSGALGVVVAPTAAQAANECGDPSANGGTSDVFICVDTAAYPAGINYTATDGDLGLLLQDGLTSGGMVQVVGSGSDDVTVMAFEVFADTGDLTINSAAMGINVQSPGGNIIVDLRDYDAGDPEMVIASTGTGIRAFASLASPADVQVLLSNGTVTSAAGIGIQARSNSGDITVQLGDSDVSAALTGVDIDTGGAGVISITSTGGSVTSTTQYAISADTGSGVTANLASDLTGAGGINVVTTVAGDITSSGNIVANGAAESGIRLLVGGGGSASLTSTGTVQSVATGVVVTAGAAGADVTVAGVTSTAGAGVSVSSDGAATLTTTGNVSGTTGITMSAGPVATATLTTGGTVTGTAGAGVSITQNDGATIVDTTAGLVTGSTNGLEITTDTGAVTATVGDVTGTSGRGVIITSGAGAVNLTIEGAVEGDSGSDVVTTTGDVTYTIAAGGSVESTNPSNYAVDILSASGDISLIVDGAVVNGGIDVDTGGAGTASFSGTGAIADTSGFLAVEIATANGDITIAYDGSLNALGDGINIASVNGDVTGTFGGALTSTNGDAVTVSVTGTGLVDLTFDGVVDGGGGAGDDGIVITTNSGALTLETNAAVFGDPGVVLASAGGVITYDANADVTGDAGGITATNTTGSITINVNGLGTDVEGDDDGTLDGVGINASTSAGGAIVVTSDAGTTISGATGVNALVTGGAGGVTINTQGSVTGTSGNGVAAQALAGGNIDIDVVDVTATSQGVVASANGGSITVDNTGTVSGDAFGIRTISTTGTTTITTAGDVTSSAGSGISADSNTGLIDINIGAFAVTGAVDGVAATSTSGDIDIDSAGAVTGTTGAGITASTGGQVNIDTTGAVSGAAGISGVTTGAGETVTITTAGVTTGTAGDGIYASSTDGAITITNNGLVSATGGSGIEADSTSGQVNVNVNANVTATGGNGVDVDTGGSSQVTVNADVSGVTGILVDAGVTGTVNGTGVVTASAGDGVSVLTGTGAANVTWTGDINATGGNGIEAVSTSGDVSVDYVSGTIAGTADWGVFATTSDSQVTINVDGDIGTAGNGTDDGGVFANITGGAGALTIDVSGDIYTAGGAPAYAAGIGVVHDGTSGDIDVDFTGAVIDSGAVGIGAIITNAASTGNVDITVAAGGSVTGDTSFGIGGSNNGSGDFTVTVGAGSTVSGGLAGIDTYADTGDTVTTIGDNSLIIGTSAGIQTEAGDDATVTLGDNVTIDPQDYGAIVVAGGDATFTAGANLNIDINNTDADAFAGGVLVVSSQAADVAVGDPSVEIDIGTGLVVTVDDGAGGEADGGFGVGGQALAGTASVAIDIADGLSVTLVGDNSVGVFGASDDGDIAITTGTGAISVAAGDGADGAANFPGSAGVAALSTGGSVTITNNATIGVTNGALDAAGIYAETTGAGTITINANAAGAITSSDTGIGAESVDGDITVNQAAVITAGITGVSAEASGAGDVTVTSTASITATGDDGIAADADTGGVTVTTLAGTTITAGNDAIAAWVNDSLATGNTSVINNATLVANQLGGFGYGIFSGNYGSGDVLITNNGAISGDAYYGITAYAGGTGGVSVVNTGAIGSAGNSVSEAGIWAGVEATSADTLFVNNTGAIRALDGIVAEQDGSGTVTVINSGALTVGGVGITSTATSGATSVTNNAGGVINAAGDGINAFALTGNVTVTNTAAITSTGADGIQTQTSGAGSSAVSNSAAINAAAMGILTATNGGSNTVTNSGAITAANDGVNASAAGSANVTVSTTAAVTSTGADGIQASSAGGAVSVTNSAAVSGAQNGIVTGNTGTGATTVTANANVTGSTVAGFAAINTATTGTGATTVTVANGVSVAGNNGSAIRTSTNGGAVTVNLGAGPAGAPATLVTSAGAGAGSWVIDLANTGASTTTVNIAANTTVRSTDATTGGYDDLAIRGTGGTIVVNNGGRLNGRVNFTGATAVTFNNTSSLSWHTTGASVFSGGADTLNNSASGVIFTNAGGVATSWDFGAGADTFTNAGILVVGEPTLAASTLTITNLEAWNNSGSIFFGSAGTTASDGQINDRIDMGSGTFTGSGNSRLFMDVNLGATPQASCGVLPTAADCFDLTGASTAGSTTIRVNDTSGVAYGAFNPDGIVVVDVNGAGTTAASHFSLLSGQPLWRADLNSADGVLDKGLFFYDLTLNGSKQHVLVGLPDGEAFEFTTVGQAAQAAWYTTTGTWFDRQADLRDQLGESEAGAGIWMKITGGQAERDLINSYELFGVTYSFDTSYEQQTISLIGGLDFVGASTADMQWVIGGMIGYVDSDVNFNASPTMASMEGAVFGVYGSYVTPNWFLDGVVSFNSMDLDYQAPSLAPAPNNVFASDVDSWGVQVEGGYKLALGENASIEPLVSLSYVNTEIGDIDVPGATIMWDDQTSLRGSIGARLSTDAEMERFNAKFALTGRVWNEFEGENGLTIDNLGPDLDLVDDFSGTFGEVTGSINLFSNEAAFSAFVNAGVKFKDDYQSTDATLGFRWRW